MVSNHELHDPIADSPVGLTETPDPVDEAERPIQIDFMKIVQTDGPASLVDTPPSSDSGIHSWGEQWENMRISTADTETEHNGRPIICSPTVTPESRRILRMGNLTSYRQVTYRTVIRILSIMRVWTLFLTVNRRRSNCCGRMTEHSQMI